MFATTKIVVLNFICLPFIFLFYLVNTYMKILIFVNKIADWQTCTLRTISVKEEIKYSIIDWNKYLDLDFFRYKKEMERIASLSWAKMSDYYFTCNINKLIEHLENFDDNDFLIPTDEDGWFNEKVHDLLYEQNNRDVVVWDSLVFQSIEKTPGTYLWSNCRGKEGICPNNFAIKVKTLRSLNKYQIKNIINSSYNVMNAVRSLNVYQSNIVCGCLNRHPGRIEDMEKNTNIDQLFKQLINVDLNKVYIPSNQIWMKPYAMEVLKLFPRMFLRTV